MKIEAFNINAHYTITNIAQGLLMNSSVETIKEELEAEYRATIITLHDRFVSLSHRDNKILEYPDMWWDELHMRHWKFITFDADSALHSRRDWAIIPHELDAINYLENTINRRILEHYNKIEIGAWAE